MQISEPAMRMFLAHVIRSNVAIMEELDAPKPTHAAREIADAIERKPPSGPLLVQPGVEFDPQLPPRMLEVNREAFLVPVVGAFEFVGCLLDELLGESQLAEYCFLLSQDMQRIIAEGAPKIILPGAPSL